jgi:hypothetical protein
MVNTSLMQDLRREKRTEKEPMPKASAALACLLSNIARVLDMRLYMLLDVLGFFTRQFLVVRMWFGSEMIPELRTTLGNRIYLGGC